MIVGVHAIVFSPAADEVRAFFGDVLRFDSVDAGGGWPIFALPPAELAVHPDAGSRHEIYLMCDDLDVTLAELQARGARLARPVSQERWGRATAIALPGGSEIALYEPSHPGPVRDRPHSGSTAG